MKNITLLFIISLLLCVGLSACDMQATSMVKSQRRFAKYIEPQNNSNVIDLSEGLKLKYDMHIGPQNLNFDFKIVNPY